MVGVNAMVVGGLAVAVGGEAVRRFIAAPGARPYIGVTTQAVRIDRRLRRRTTSGHFAPSSTGSANGDNARASRSALRTAAGSSRAARSPTWAGNASALASVM